jgi:hypothetical protein
MNSKKPLPPGHYVVKQSDMVVDLSTPGVVKYKLKPEATPVAEIPAVPSRTMKRLKRDPLKNHPRAAKVRQAMAEARFDDEQEAADIQASELACAVADAWVVYRGRFSLEAATTAPAQKLSEALNRLELVTRASGMRRET